MQNEDTTRIKKGNWLGIKRPAAFFLLFWLALNLVQVALMELTSDEGYYWFYAQHLQWGYYDHPPMIAAMIKAGTAILPGELGVRFFNVVFSTAGLYLFFRLLPADYLGSTKTYLVLFAAPLLHYLTFLVFPDGPLLLFSLLFLYTYKQFLHKQSLSISFLLGLSLALMAYSKYHGALVLLFTVLANPGLLRTSRFYLSIGIAVVCFLPHIWWQYSNDFPTLQYHLSGRTSNWSFKHVGEYLSQQIFAIGPGLIFLPFIIKTSDVFERTLKFIIIGTLAFFLISSFKTFVHFHWTSIALFPLLYFAVGYYQNSQEKKLFKFFVIPFVFLFFVVRLLLMFPLIPAMHVGEDYYHGRNEWAGDIAAIAGQRPVLMPNNLREASLYSFYSDRQGIALYTRPEKKSQYELWGYEDSLQGKEVMVVLKDSFPRSKPLPNTLQQRLYYDVFPAFSSYYSGVLIRATIAAYNKDTIAAAVTIINKRTLPLLFSNGLKGETTTLVASVEKGKATIQASILERLSFTLAPSDSITRFVRVPVADLASGDYTLFFGIRNGLLPDAILSAGHAVTK